MFFTDIPSPVGPLRLASDGTSVTGLWLENQKYFSAGLDPAAQKAPALPIFREAALWLDDYFAGNRPSALPPLSPAGSAFQQSVWNRLLDIPCGQTRTYGALAADLGSSPRAVGSAVSRNPISILIPCHRVLGTDGSLTGYAGGLEKKRFLLMLEGVDTTRPNTRAEIPVPAGGQEQSVPLPRGAASPAGAGEIPLSLLRIQDASRAEGRCRRLHLPGVLLGKRCI